CAGRLPAEPRRSKSSNHGLTSRSSAMSMSQEELLRDLARMGRESPPVRPDGAAPTDTNVHPTPEPTPTTNGVSGDGRAPDGRFAAGNKGGPGNPFAREVAAVRKTLLERLTQEKRDAVADELIALAMEGNLQAIKLLYAYTIGKPTPAPDPDQ